MDSRPALRVGPVSVVRRPAMVAVTLILAGVLAIALCVNIGRGDLPLSITDVTDILFGGGTRAQRFIVLDLRLPRAATGLAVGAALGIAGALSQSILRNPLASPDLLGITSGAGVAAVALIVAGTGSATGLFATIGLPMAALGGAVLTAVAIYLLAWRNGVDGYRLVLIGIGVNAMLVAVISWLLVNADIADVATAQKWLNGSLVDGDWTTLWPVAAGLAVAGGVALLSVSTLGVIRLGDDKARSLGVALQSRQGILLLASVILAAVATSAAGPVGFVALAAPQIARRVLRSAGEPIIGSALVGAILVVGSDVIARTLLPVALPAGIVTSALGGPFLLYLLVRNNRKVSA
ncbi:FecCD family ABC transporter permease [Antrihabitans cavernicola]